MGMDEPVSLPGVSSSDEGGYAPPWHGRERNHRHCWVSFKPASTEVIHPTIDCQRIANP